MKLSLHSKRDGLAAGLSLTLILLVAGTLRAATLDDYQARLSNVVAFLELTQTYFNQSGHSGGHTAPSDLDFVREQLPAKETIHFQGRTIAVDNSWLDDELKEFGKFTKATDRASTVARIAERLKSIQEQVRALQSAATPPGDKDADKGRLAEILRRPEYNTKVEPQGNALERLIDRLLRWLEKFLPKSKPITPGSSRFVAQGAQILVVGLCIGAIVFLIWRYGPRWVSGRGKKRKKKKREARIVLGERLEADQTAADLLAQAEALAREGNLRAAIRKAYIALLCELGDRKIVSLAQHKTNRDYLNAVRDKGSLYTSMRKLTYMFELHWYGFAPAGEAEWDEFRNGYKKIFRNDQ